MKNNRGMALVVALLTSFILLALVASLFWVIASTSRQSEYAKNSAIALNLAEAGTADAIYRLNYCGTDGIGNYPFAFSDPNPFGTSLVINLSDPDHDILIPGTFSNLFIGLGSGIKGTFTENNGTYYVGIQSDADNASPDTLISVGIYKGVRRVLTVPLRGNNVAAILRQGPFQGISEAFNKHVIYADTVTGTTTKVKGNIAYKISSDNPPTIDPNYPWTKTQVDPALFRIPTPSIPSDLALPPATFNVYFKEPPGHPSNEVWGFRYDATGADTLFGPTSTGVAYDSATQEYTFTDTQIAYSFYVQGTGGGNARFVHGAGTANSLSQYVKAYNGIKITGDLTINSSNVILDGTTSNTISTGIPGINISGGALKIKGTSLGFSGTGTITLTDNDVTSTDNGIIMLYNSTGNATFNLLSSVGLNIISTNTSRTAALIVCANGDAFVTISSTFNPTLASSNQAAIIAYSNGTVATITIEATVANSTNGRLIYAGSYQSIVTNVATINLNTGADVNGCLVAGGTNATTPGTGTINLNGGTLNYDSSAFTGASSGFDIFSGFSSGRRAYVPTWQGWRLR